MTDYNTGAVPDGVSQGLEQMDRVYKNGKIADSIVKVNPGMLDALGMSPPQFGSLSASDRASAVTGAITAMGMKQQQQQMAMQQQRMAAQAADSQAQAQQRQQQAEDDAATGRAANAFVHATPGQITPGIPLPPASGAPGAPPANLPPLQPSGGFGMSLSPAAAATLPPAGAAYAPATLSPGAAAMLPTLADRYNAALGTPGIGGRNLAPLLKQLGMLAPAFDSNPNGTPITFEEDSTTGRRFARLGKQVLPSGTDPAMAPAALPESFNKNMEDLSSKIANSQEVLGMTDEELAAKDPNTPPAAQRTVASGRLRVAQQIGKGNVDRLLTQKKISADQRDDFYDQIGISGGAPAGPGGLPVVKSQTDYDSLKNGAQYQDAQGKKYTKGAKSSSK